MLIENLVKTIIMKSYFQSGEEFPREVSDWNIFLSKITFKQKNELIIKEINMGLVVASLVKEVCDNMNFSLSRVEEAMIVAAELTENIAKHVGRGTIKISAADKYFVLKIVAEDEGMPIKDIDLAFTDGCSDTERILPEKLFQRLGLGCGLGAIRRFSNAINIETGATGKSITTYLLSEKNSNSMACILQKSI